MGKIIINTVEYFMEWHRNDSVIKLKKRLGLLKEEFWDYYELEMTDRMKILLREILAIDLLLKHRGINDNMD